MNMLFWIFISFCIISFFITQYLYKKYISIQFSYDKTLQEHKLVLSFLQEISEVFTKEINLDSLLQSIAVSSVRMLKARSGAIFIMNEDKNTLKASIIEGTFPPWHKMEPSVTKKILSKTKYLDEYLKAQEIRPGDGIIGQAASTGRPYLVSNASTDRRIPKFPDKELEIHTMLVVPLKIKDETLGVLALVNKQDNEPFNEINLSLLNAIGNQAAVAIRNARFYKTIIEKQKLDRDLTIAKDIQHMLLPEECPKIEGIDIKAWNNSAMDIGGDYYDFIDIGKNKLGVVIADVSGKSIPGALVMNTTRSILRSKAIGVHSTSSVLMAVNEMVYQDIDPDMFVSLLYLIIDTKTKTATYARAGHEPMILYQADSNKCELVNSKGMVLGMDKGPLFDNALEELNIQLAPQDALVLYTDGITEALNSEREEFGINNLIEAVHIAGRGTAADIVSNIADRIKRFTAGTPQQDDLTLIAIKVN